MDRLTLPKRQAATDAEMSLGKATSATGVPPNPLPIWEVLPLDTKLPMIPGPKGATVLYTTNLGEKIHKSSLALDFDLTDPYSMLMSNYYKPLHDPHLKPHLTGPLMRSRLYRDGFITKNGKVLCTLKEFNEYRQYLGKINLALDRKREKEERRSPSSGSPSQLKKDDDTSALSRTREDKIKEIRERLAQQLQDDKARYTRIMQEEEERHRRLREDHFARQTEKETRQRAQEERRLATVIRCQQEERRRRMALIRRWLEEDARRTALAESRRHVRNQLHQTKLEETWEMRKQVQQARLDEERRRHSDGEKLKQKRIKDRERVLTRQRERQQAVLTKMTEQRRAERERMEAEYARMFSAKMDKMDKKRIEATRRRRHQRKERKSEGKSRLKSNWDLEKTLLESLSDDEVEMLRRSFSCGEAARASFVKISKEKRLEKSVSELGLGDFKGASFNDDVIRVADNEAEQKAIDGMGAGHVTETPSAADATTKGSVTFVGETKKPLSLQEWRQLTGVSSSPVETERMEPIEEAAKVIVDVTVFITTQIVYPAYVRYLQEDYPDVYIQYYERPETPMPPSDLSSVDFESPSPPVSQESSADMAAVDSDHLLTTEQQKGPSQRSVSFNVHTDEIGSGELVDSMYSLEEEDENDMYQSSRLGLSSRDSLTLLHGYFPSEDAVSPEMLQELLMQILQALSSGLLAPNQVAQLSGLAQDIVRELPAETATHREETFIETELGEILTLSDVTDKSPEPVSSSTSDLASEVVRHTMAHIEQQLLESSELRDPAGISSSSMANLVQFIVERVVASSIQKLGGKPQECKSPTPRHLRPGSAPPTPTAEVRDGRLKGSASPGSFEADSSTSDFIQGVLDRVTNEVAIEMSRTPTPGPTVISETTLLVKNVLSEALHDLQDTGFKADLNWDAAVPLSAAASSASSTSNLIKDTLARVLHEMQEEGAIPPVQPTKSASSTFANALIAETLQQCLAELRSGAMSPASVNSLAIAIMQSHRGLKAGGKIKERPPECTRSLSALPQAADTPRSSSLLVAALIKETLERVKAGLQTGNIPPEQATTMARAISSGQLSQVFLRQSSSTKIRSDTSSLAERNVIDTLKEILSQMKRSESRESGPGRSSTSVLAQETVAKTLQEQCVQADESAMAVDVVTRCIDEVLEDLKHSPLPPVFSTPSSLARKASDSSASTISRQASNVVQQTIQDVLADAEFYQKIDANSSKDVDLTAESGISKQGRSIPDHIIITSKECCDDSSEDEVEIEPVLDGKPLGVDHHIVEEALAIISVKEDADLDHSLDPTARNSFRDLIHPEVSKVHRLSQGSAKDVCSRIMTLSSLHIAHAHSYDFHEEDEHESVDKGFHSAPNAQIDVSSSSESDDPGEGAVVSVMTLHTRRSVDEVHKDDAPKQKKSTTSSTSIKKNAPKTSGTASKTSSRTPSKKSVDATKKSSSKTIKKGQRSPYESGSKGSGLSLRQRASKTVSTCSTGVAPTASGKVSMSSRQASVPFSDTSVKLEDRQKTASTTSSVKSGKQRVTQSEQKLSATDKSPGSSHKASSTAVPCSGPASLTAVNLPSKSTVSLEARRLSNADASKEKVSAKTQATSSTTLKNRRSSGAVREFTTSATHLPVGHKQSIKQILKDSTSNTSRSSKQSHQMLNLTPRPSSAYRKSPSAQQSKTSQNSKTNSSASSLQSLVSESGLSQTAPEDLNMERSRHTSEGSGDVMLSPKASISSLMRETVNAQMQGSSRGRVTCTRSDTKAMRALAPDGATTSTTSLPQMTSHESTPVASSQALKATQRQDSTTNSAESETILAETERMSSKTSSTPSHQSLQDK